MAYDPADPAGTARAATFWATWGIALWLLPFALVFSLFPWLRDRFGLTIERTR